MSGIQKAYRSESLDSFQWELGAEEPAKPANRIRKCRTCTFSKGLITSIFPRVSLPENVS